MRYVIIEIPKDSANLINSLGYGRIKCFVSNKMCENISGIPIVPFKDLQDVANGNIVVISDYSKREKYEYKLKTLGIKKYCTLNQPSYILFGAGVVGVSALSLLGKERVHCFLDNNKGGNTVLGKPVISFDQLPALLDEHKVMITSTMYSGEMREQLEQYKVNNYMFLSNILPHYYLYKKTCFMHYHEILSNYNIAKYNKIVIYGTNDLIQELICEIGFQNNIDNIIGIIDHTGKEKINEIMGIPLGTLEAFEEEIDCLILNIARMEDDGLRDKWEIAAPSFEVVDIFDIDKFISAFNHPELKRYKNKHKGQRAFLIGNGPSLRMEDLDTLQEHGEICFGVNAIYRAYDRTKWRATYYCIGDSDAMINCGDEVDQLHGEDVFYGDNFHLIRNVEQKKNRQYVHITCDAFDQNKPGFSSDITKASITGYCTTMYDMVIQIAAYMGFAELYLIGNDFSYIERVTDVRNHFIADYYNEIEIKNLKRYVTQKTIDRGIRSFEKAEEYSRAHGFRIYNATRGGALEVFERVDFDSLFE